MWATLHRTTGIRALSPPEIAIIVGSIGAGLLLDVAVASGHARLVLTLLAMGIATAVGIANWRWSLVGLLAYLPFSGIPILLLHPNTAPAVLAKDALFVGPAYAGVLIGLATRRQSITIPGAPVLLLLGFAAWAGVQSVHFQTAALLQSLIGLKVWLWYIPLYFLGYHLLRDRDDLHRLLTLMVVLALVPIAIGLAEAIAIYTGHAADVYGWYGDAAYSATQRFAETRFVGGGRLYRIPSIFSFVTQYYLFASVMMSIAYAWWRLGSRRETRSVLGPLTFVLMIIATLLTGARAAFLFVPLTVVSLILLDRPRVGAPRATPLWVLIGGGAAVLALIGTSALGVARLVVPYAVYSFRTQFLGGIATSVHYSWLGIGTGSDTGAARYAIEGGITSGTLGTASPQEGWYAKAMLELGIPGLLLLTLILAVLGVRAFRHHRAIRDPRVRAVSAAILVMFLWAVANGAKSSFVDLDPLNVYFWLLMGIHERLPSFDQPTPAAPVVATSRARRVR